MALSNSASASDCLSRAFSWFNSYSFGEALRLEAFRFGCFLPPVQLLPQVIGGSRNLQGSADVGNALTLVKKLISSSQLADDSLGTVAFVFYGASSGQV